MEGTIAAMEQMEELTAGEAVDRPEAEEIEPRRVVEAVLFAADSPLAPAKIASILGVGDARDVRKHVTDLNEEYEARGQSFRIEEVAGGFQMLTLPVYNTWLTKLLRARQETKLSGAAMETLAVVAYKQPVTRAEIEAVRGVAAGEMLSRLREINLVKIVGRAEDLGRPLLYGTTRRFLEVFGLASLEDLPQVEALASGSGPAGTTRQAVAAEEAAASQGGDGDELSSTEAAEPGPQLSIYEGDDAGDGSRPDA